MLSYFSIYFSCGVKNGGGGVFRALFVLEVILTCILRSRLFCFTKHHSLVFLASRKWNIRDLSQISLSLSGLYFPRVILLSSKSWNLYPFWSWGRKTSSRFKGGFGRQDTTETFQFVMISASLVGGQQGPAGNWTSCVCPFGFTIQLISYYS